jgi:ankyrin repeat protein
MKIHGYAHRGDLAGLRQELELGINIDSIDNQADLSLGLPPMTPLQSALASPIAGVDTIEFLIDRGAKLGKFDFFLAVFAGKIEKIQFLLDLGVDINEVDLWGHNALIHLFDIYTGGFSLPVDGADKFSDIQIDFPHIYKPASPPIELVKFLLARGINPHANKTAALTTAADYGLWEIVRVLMDAGCDLAVLEWRTGLMRAVGLGTVSEVVAQLVTADPVDLEVLDSLQRTPWLLSVHLGDVSKAQSLLAAGSNPLAVGEYGKLPLMYAIESRNLAMLAWSIEIGLDVNATDECGRTALMLAVDLDLPDAVSMLLAAGANPAFRSSEFEDGAIDRVCSLEVLERLVASGVDLYGIRPFKPSLRSLFTKVATPDELLLDPQDYYANRHPHFGRSNPEVMDILFWREMVKLGWGAYYARRHYQDINYNNPQKPIWCFSRYGQSMTHLPDGRIIAIAGEHESACTPEFCIYNDVVVYDGRGDFQIYGYPDIFIPTDFHTATLVDNWIYIIGNVGYFEDRIVGTTPVYRLNCTTFAIEPIVTTGDCPGWIHSHRAVARVGGATSLENHQIYISGGRIWTGDDNYIDNSDEYIFNSNEYRWERVKVQS